MGLILDQTESQQLDGDLNNLTVSGDSTAVT